MVVLLFRRPARNHSVPYRGLTFVSHADKDEEFAAHLVEAIKDATGDFDDDMEVRASIGKDRTPQAAEANQAIVVLSRSYLTEERSMKELSIFLAEGIEIYPLYYKVTPDEFWGIIGNYDRQASYTIKLILPLVLQ